MKNLKLTLMQLTKTLFIPLAVLAFGALSLVGVALADPQILCGGP
jgi:hypothetical protein